MKREIILPLVACSGVACTSTAAVQEQPNIVVMIADDISYNDLGCYGHSVIRTPNIDALAASGMRFTNSYLTASSSSPSRTSIITGRYPHNTGACELHSPIGDEQVSIAGVLQDAGYYTGQAGKWHFGTSAGKPNGPFAADFDRSGGAVNDGGGDSGTGRWVEYLQERPTDKPFFMWFAAHDAHRDWDDDQSMPRYSLDEVIVPKFYIDNEATRQDLADYYYEVTRFDRAVGEVVAELKRQNIFDNTLIVIMADNARPFPRYKTRVSYEGLRTFMVMSYPNGMKKSGVDCNSLMSVIDLAPTFADLASAETSERFQGRSFKKLFSSPKDKFRNYVFGEHNWHDFEALERMVCDGEMALIENKRPMLNGEGAIDVMGGGAGRSLLAGNVAGTLNDDQNEIFKTPRPTISLFNSIKDPAHEHNLASQQPEEVERLMALLREWQEQTGDSYPEIITSDWYSRETLLKTPEFKVRKEMPGASNNATMINASGPF